MTSYALAVNGASRTVDIDDPSQPLLYVPSARLVLPSPAAPLSDPVRYRLVGQRVPRPDLPAKVSSRHVYVHDQALPSSSACPSKRCGSSTWTGPAATA